MNVSDRLRVHAGSVLTTTDRVLVEAADEIDRLRATVESFAAVDEARRKEVDSLRAELAECKLISVARQAHIERLCRRNKLQCAANGCPGCAVCGPVAALAAKGEPSMTRVPAPGSRWRHSNGNEYEVMCIANLHSTNPQYRTTVVYVGTNGRVWARPLTDWHRSMTPIAAEGEK